MESNDTTLKRFLLQLPTYSQFEFNKSTRKEIRKQLFCSISNNGKYLNWLFPNAFTGDPNIDFMIDKIDKDFDWKFTNYYKTLLLKRDPKHDTHSHHAFHPNMACSRIFRKGEPIYRCLTCAFDDTCALCSHCYQPEYHKGHNLHIAICQKENGGVCDCGDPEAWVNTFYCPYSLIDDTAIDDKKLPEDLKVSILSTIGIILDFLIDVIIQCDLQFEDPQDLTTTKIELNTINSTFDSIKYQCNNFVDSNNGKYFLLIYNDQIRHYRDAVQRIHLSSRKVIEFATMITDKVQKFGKAKVISSKNINYLLERQKVLSATGLSSCIRSHRDVFREDMCEEIITWLGNLTDSEIFKTNTEAENLFTRAFCERWQNGLLVATSSNDDNYQYKCGTLDSNLKIPKIPSREKSQLPYWSYNVSLWDLDEETCKECDYNLNLDDYELNKSHHGSRLQYLIYLDIRIWKASRNVLHDIYSTSLTTNLRYKTIINSQYVDVYPQITDMFLNMDREPESNIMSNLSTQLFTCPANATAIVKHGDITRIFSAIYGFLTIDEIETPENLKLTHQISTKNLKNRRWGQIFFDISYIISRGKDLKEIYSRGLIPMACDILALFQGRPVMIREKTNHVEYESPDYTAFFNAISVIYTYGKYIAEAIAKPSFGDSSEKACILHEALKWVLMILLNLENMTYPGLTDDDIDINTNRSYIKEPITGETFIDCKVYEDKVSFLHPLHSFLSWLIESADCDDLKYVLDNYEKPIESIIFDYPIKTIVLMSQIKAGFWVRNGFSVKSQLQLYKNTLLRETGYMRDLYLIQLFTNIANPNLVTYQILHRWGLLGNWHEKEEESVYDDKTLIYMLEECLNFFIHILTEDIYLKGLKNDVSARLKIEKEIIHNLCFSPMGYTKLCSLIPDHIVNDMRFSNILREMTNYKPPKNSTDFGNYSLKDKYLDEVNPYYFNYTANIKDEALKFVKERVSKNTGKTINEIIIEPRPINVEELGNYKYIGNFSTSIHFTNFLSKILIYSKKKDIGEVENLLETAFHLIHICSLEQLIDKKFGTFLFNFINDEDLTSVAELLYEYLINDDYKCYHTKIRSIFKVFKSNYKLKSFSSLLGDQFDESKIIESSHGHFEDELDKKKRIAKQRQTRLLAKLKKQQSSFLQQNKFDTDDDINMDEFNSELHGWKFPEPHCMLCQNAAEDAGPFGIIIYISKSSEFRNVPFDNEYWFTKAFSDNVDLDVNDENIINLHNEAKSNNWKTYMDEIKTSNVIGPGFNSDNSIESKLVSSSCGHGMHYNCYVNYLNNSRNRSNQITRNTPENVDHKEFLCPLCKALSNMFIPVLWSNNNRNLINFLKADNQQPFEKLNYNNIKDKNWVENFTTLADQDIENMSILTPSAKELVTLNDTNDNQQFRTLLNNKFQLLSLLTFPQIYKLDSVSILVNTIKSIEMSLRGVSSDGKLIFMQLSNNALINLRVLNEFRHAIVLMKVKNWLKTTNPRTDAHAKILANLLSLSKNSINQTILEGDFFEILVNIVPLPSVGFSFKSILEITFIGHLIQSLHIILKKVSQNILENYHWKITVLDIPAISNINSKTIESIRCSFDKFLGSNSEVNDEFCKVIYSMLIKSITPFLRRAAIYSFAHCANIDNVYFSPQTEIEADRLTSFFNLKPVSEYLTLFNTGNSFESELFNNFANYIKISKSSNNLVIKKELEYPGLIKLVELPDRLDFFFTKYYYSDRYNNPHMTIEDPAICLFCGCVVDVQKQSIGSQFGQCTTHYLKECSNDIGIFLLPKDRTLLLLHKNGGSFYSVPFLDDHGELPDDSKKAGALHLMKPRYDEFMKSVWLQHNIPNYIVRNLESVLDPGGWETL
ncbi:unnamed protein product [Candida verbasci]|uniref:E3 ubiquitin-protein ligase n=1 Tax=Candida verbasci TaxID=1227364 RepID=A0A9W4TY43_9ASCO|nr:unnamed protein product [Candida verbasci]